ncbi:MAG: hypothetical protein KatS3mg033_0989 [Thermonema sp.]|nr:MAG: hypothetical protein KatS3mg033_0989 [Thermonema sp.]
MLKSMIKETEENKWTTFRGNKARTGSYSGKAPWKHPHLKWKFKTGDVVSSSPAVSDGIVFFGSWDYYLHALG